MIYNNDNCYIHNGRNKKLFNHSNLLWCLLLLPHKEKINKIFKKLQKVQNHYHQTTPIHHQRSCNNDL